MRREILGIIWILIFRDVNNIIRKCQSSCQLGRNLLEYVLYVRQTSGHSNYNIHAFHRGIVDSKIAPSTCRWMSVIIYVAPISIHYSNSYFEQLVSNSGTPGIVNLLWINQIGSNLFPSYALFAIFLIAETLAEDSTPGSRERTISRILFWLRLLLRIVSIRDQW